MCYVVVSTCVSQTPNWPTMILIYDNHTFDGSLPYWIRLICETDIILWKWLVWLSRLGHKRHFQLPPWVFLESLLVISWRHLSSLWRVLHGKEPSSTDQEDVWVNHLGSASSSLSSGKYLYLWPTSWLQPYTRLWARSNFINHPWLSEI